MAYYTVVFGKKMESMGLSVTWRSWTFSFFQFGFNIAPCVAGPLTERLGWKSVSFAAGMLSSIAVFIITFTNSQVVFSALYSLVLGEFWFL